MIIQTTIGEFCPFEYGKGLSINKRLSGNIPVYGSNGIVGVHNEPYVPTHGIIIGRKGSVGALQISDRPFWPIDTSFYVVKDDYFETVYTFYLLKSLGLDGMNSDSAVPGLNRDNAHALKVNILGTSEERKATGRLIARFDDKIENNRRMNVTLEEMARAIFKSWFVDFDPVHAKAAGNAPAHMDVETAELFPSSFDDDGLPVGWINKTLGDFIEIQNGYAFKSKDWTDEGIPVVKIGSVKPSIVDLSNCSFVSAEVAELKRNFQLRVGDILIGLTGYVGEVGRVPPADKMPMLNQRVGRVVCKRESFEPFVYAAMRLPEFKSFAESQSHGSAQANVSTKQLQEYPVVVANNLLIQKFNEILESYFEKILTNSAENQTLAELRDTLLPKLMSGEMRVKDAEREVEAAV